MTFKEPVLKIAEEPIQVFKIMLPEAEGKIRSFFMSALFTVGEEYASYLQQPVLFNNDEPGGIIEVGIHSYKGIPFDFRKDSSRYDFIFLHTEEEKNICSYWKNDNIIKVNCTLPVGTHYYENEYGEVVSDRIIFDSIEEIPWPEE